MRITPINYANSYQKPRPVTGVAQKHVLPQNSHHITNFLPQISGIFFTGDSAEKRTLSGKHEKVVIDKNTVLSGDAKIAELVVKPSMGKNDTRLTISGDLRVGKISSEPKNGVKNSFWLQVSGCKVNLIENFWKVKLAKDAAAQGIINTGVVECYDNANAESICAKDVFMLGNSSAGTIEAFNISLNNMSRVFDSVAFIEGKDGAKLPPKLAIQGSAELEDGCFLDLNGHPECILVINGRELNLADTSLAGQSKWFDPVGLQAVSVPAEAERPREESSAIRGFDSVAGMEELKKELTRTVINPIIDPRYKEMGIKPPNGILFYGPPGCGKTHIAKALAKETGRSFFEIRLSDIGSSFINQTALNLKKKFDEALKQKPAVIFLDEIESIARSRSELSDNNEAVKVVNELLTSANNCAEEDVLIIYATNAPEMVDGALKRSGRIDKHVEIPLPDLETRTALLKMYINKYKKVSGEIDYEALAKQTEGFVSADFQVLANNAAILAVDENSSITQAGASKAIEDLREGKEKKKQMIGFGTTP